MKKLQFLLLLILIVGCGKDPTDHSAETIIDSRDKHIYRYVKIGTQTWMAENLAYLPAVSPQTDGSATTPVYYVYGYRGSNIIQAKTNANYSTYGVLYNWEAAKTACPAGWHLPTDAEWTILEDNLGALPGKKMKSLTEWRENGNGDNSTGFNAFPGGSRIYMMDRTGTYYSFIDFIGLGYITYFWSASENGSSFAWYRNLHCTFDTVSRYYDNRSYGYSVRCLQN